MDVNENIIAVKIKYNVQFNLIQHIYKEGCSQLLLITFKYLNIILLSKRIELYSIVR